MSISSNDIKSGALVQDHELFAQVQATLAQPAALAGNATASVGARQSSRCALRERFDSRSIVGSTKQWTIRINGQLIIDD